MKNKKIKAFSMVEVIVVISILIIISSSWIIYFTWFIDDLSFKKTISDIKEKIDSLDNKINKKEIFDYEISFKKWDIYYVSNENLFDLDVHIEIKELINNEIQVWFSWSTSWTWIIKYYENYKFKKSKLINYNWTLTWNFENPSSYKITGSFSWITLNDINFNYFDEKKFIKLVRIDTNTNTDLPTISLKNIIWKKSFWGNEINNEINLTFENNDWKTEVLQIIK